MYFFFFFGEHSKIFAPFRLQHKDVFDLIKTHNLYDSIHGVIVQLIELDNEKAIAMLLEKNKIAPDAVVQQLEQRQEFLYLVGRVAFAQRRNGSLKYFACFFSTWTP